jgi:hypothetical protein
MHLMNIFKHKCIHETNLKSIALLDAFFLVLLRLKLLLKQIFKLFKRIKKDIYIGSNPFFFLVIQYDIILVISIQKSTIIIRQ